MPGLLAVARIREGWDASIGEFHGRNEAIAAAGDRFDIPAGLGTVGEGVAEFADGSVQSGLKIDKGIFRPEVPFQFLAGDELALAFGERS